MNYVIELFNNQIYELNDKGTHPALFVYNEKIVLDYIEKAIVSVINENDKIIFLVSDKNSEILKRYSDKKNEFIYSYQELRYNILENEGIVVVNARFCITEDIMKDFVYQIHNSNRNCVYMKDKNNIVILSYAKSLEYISEDKREDFFSCCDLKNDGLTVEYKDSVNDLAKKEGIFDLYDMVEYPLKFKLIELFSDIVKKYPEKIAIKYNDIKFTYSELDKITDKIAYNILRSVDGISNNIGILMGHNWKYVMSMIGILKAGMTYVPMSKLYPIERLELINRIADLDGVIVEDMDKQYTSKFKNQFVFDNLCISKKLDLKKQLRNVSDNSIAYIMFTSGSTGEPKGVRISQKNIINNAYYLNNKVFLGKKIKPQNYGVFAEFVFDMSVQQIYPALLFGNTLNIFPDDKEKTPDNILKFFANVECSDATPIALRLIVDYTRENPENYSYIHLVVGGEKLSYNLCKEYFNTYPDNDITNIYGPTECTVEVTYFYINKEILSTLNGQVPIGHAVDNSRIYLLNENNEMLPPNITGEICVGGVCVGNGYINSLSKSFCKDILSDGTMYKTGDLGYFNENGLLYYVGRNDRQVKVNGYRVDLGDIEKNLEKVNVIKEARVFYLNCNSEGKKLVAYIIGKEKEISLKKLLSDIREILPGYMIPSYFIQVSKFPTNINGKMDYSKLPNISNALKIKNDKKLSYSNDDIVANEILNYLEKEFLCKLVGESDCDLQSIGCDSLEFFKVLAFVEDKYKIAINKKMDLYTGSISVLIEKVKTYICNCKKLESQIYVYKKRYQSLPMQNYLRNQEDYNIMINSNCKRFNIMIYLYELINDINEDLLIKSIDKVVSRHDAFNMNFKCVGNNSRILYNEKSKYNIECIEYNGDINNIYEIIPDIRYFDDILAYFYIVKSEGNRYLFTGIHHLIYDYMSAIFFMRDVESYYYNSTCNDSSFFRIIEKMNLYTKSDSYLDGTNYWRNSAKQTLNIDNICPGMVMDYKKESLIYNIKGIELDACSEKYGVSKYIILLGIYYLSVLSVTNQKKVTIGTFLNGREDVFPTDAIGFLSKYVPFTFEKKSECLEDIFKELSNEWNTLKKYESSADINLILDNMQQPCNIMFDYQVMYNTQKSYILYNNMFTFEQVQEGFALTYKLYQYRDFLMIEICYDKNIDNNIIKEIKENYKNRLLEIIRISTGYIKED